MDLASRRQSAAWAFGVFLFDADSGELTRSGRAVPLAPLPAQALALLLERAGRVVDRAALTERLWGEETYVDATAGIHTAIRQIRRALGDDATHSRFIETLPRRGYRFVAPVEHLGEQPAQRAADGSPGPWGQLAGRRIAPWLSAVALVVIAGWVAASLLDRTRQPFPPVREAGVHPAALDAYFKGRFVLESPRPESTDRAIGFFERALRIDETHALSWVGLAEALLRRAGQSEGPTPYREALEAAERAVTVAPGLGSAWAARGQARWLADWDWEGAGVDFREALERAPDEGRVHLAYAFYLSATGRHEEAVHHGLESRRLAPLDPAANLDLAWLYLYARRWDQVLAESLNALALEPGLFTAHYTAAMAYRHLGEIAQAEESYLRMWRAAGAGSGRIEATRVLPVAERDEAMRQRWMTGEGATRLPAFERALISLSRGESDGVWEALSESVARREFHATMLAVDPRLDSIRDEPEFQELLAATRSVPRVLETPSS